MKKLSLPIISVTALFLSVISLILRTVCVFAFFDKSGYYQSGAILPIITNVLAVISIVLFFIAALLYIDSSKKISTPNNAAKYSALLPLGALVFFTVQTITNLVNSLQGIEPQSNFIPILTILGAIAGGVFFFLIFFTDKQKNVTVYCGLGALVFVFFSWMSTYFEFSSPINSTQRVLFYVSCAGAMLFIFNEMCAIYGAVKPKFYYFSIFTAILTLASSAIPAIVGYATNKFEVYSTLEEDLFFTALLVYAVVRLITLSVSDKKSEQLPKEEAETGNNEEITE